MNIQFQNLKEMTANKRYLKFVIFILVSAFLFSSCLSQKKMTELVQSKVEKEIVSNHHLENEFIVLNTDSLKKSDNYVVVKNGKSYFIPAILVWAWNKKIDCEISGQYFSSLFAALLIDKVKEFNLEKHLGNKKMEISLIQVPSNFVYSNSGYFIYALVFYSYGFGETIQPNNQQFVFKYRITENGEELKTDRFVFKFENQIQNTRFSTNKFVEKYIDQLSADFEIKSNEFIEKIIEDL